MKNKWIKNKPPTIDEKHSRDDFFFLWFLVFLDFDTLKYFNAIFM